MSQSFHALLAVISERLNDMTGALNRERQVIQWQLYKQCSINIQSTFIIWLCNMLFYTTFYNWHSSLLKICKITTETSEASSSSEDRRYNSEKGKYESTNNDLQIKKTKQKQKNPHYRGNFISSSNKAPVLEWWVRENRRDI